MGIDIILVDMFLMCKKPNPCLETLNSRERKSENEVEVEFMPFCLPWHTHAQTVGMRDSQAVVKTAGKNDWNFIWEGVFSLRTKELLN